MSTQRRARHRRQSTLGASQQVDEDTAAVVDGDDSKEGSSAIEASEEGTTQSAPHAAPAGNQHGGEPAQNVNEDTAAVVDGGDGQRRRQGGLLRKSSNKEGTTPSAPHAAPAGGGNQDGGEPAQNVPAVGRRGRQRRRERRGSVRLLFGRTGILLCSSCAVVKRNVARPRDAETSVNSLVTLAATVLSLFIVSETAPILAN